MKEGENEELEQFRLLQLEEINAIHCIYPPVMVANTGNIDFTLVPQDLMIEKKYKSLTCKSNCGTRIKLFECNIKGEVRMDLIKFGFVVSTITNEEIETDSNINYVAVEVIYPKLYPKVAPFLNIVFTMKLTEETRGLLVEKITNVVGEANGEICIFDVSVVLDEFLRSSEENTHSNLWEEMAGRLLQQPTANKQADDATTISSNVVEHNPQSYQSNLLSSDSWGLDISHIIQKSVVEEHFIYKYSEQFVENDFEINLRLAEVPKTEDDQRLISNIDIIRDAGGLNFAKWSTHAIIQAPLWYESIQKDSEQSLKDDTYPSRYSGGYLANHFPISLGEMKLSSIDLVSRSHSNTFASSKSLDSDEKISQDNTDCQRRSISIPEMTYPLSPPMRFKINDLIAYLTKVQGEVQLNRFKKDFEIKEQITDFVFNSIYTCRHKVDQNLYFVWEIQLPTLCSYKSLDRTFDDQVNQEACFIENRRYISSKLLSRVGKLSTLQHYSIISYNQYWIEKERDMELINSLLDTAHRLYNGEHVIEETTNDNADNKVPLVCLIRGVCRLNDNKNLILSEQFTRRRIYLQTEYVNGWTLEEEIRKHELYRNEQRIWAFIRHILDVLVYLHGQKVYHQQLCTSNIYIYEDGCGPKLKVGGFGITESLRQISHCDYCCLYPKCSCREYTRVCKSVLYQSHPSKFGVGPEPNLDSLEDVMDYEAEQEDMFAFGVLMFLMCRPPMNPSTQTEELREMLADETFPQMYLKDVPQALVKTIHRLTRKENRPTAADILQETLVPPVIDAELLGQYIRRLHNSSSEEALGAVKFFLDRGWKQNVSSLLQNLDPLHQVYIASDLVNKLESFMRLHSVMIVPPVVLCPRGSEKVC
ncbi:bifunctional RWD domain/Ubiquitin-conjugating enzyme-RWD-like/Protein kinase-like domain superfamily/Protein kinase domain [Babesia duncani]|uniref:Bifunctional RWD domain/Ubiquitin-conjugating enzyme-RWD-like/Protein kinase-like domain superfamily/Protein kinase domain n=1 Tax=Babesia duncani TaxID=323732 RepID=A0AAD9PMC7_9APIC|nr:bifunctional RWD domain/Ubiquitin-conjugating enzyme-RWD-like/Protein kinase-like domain superfamily/Protein kinase domain [Babesia duncani]